MLTTTIVIVSALAAVCVTILFITTRESTKHHRQGIVKDLGLVFGKSQSDQLGIIPSFEFVKYKYFVDTVQRDKGIDHDFKWRHWILSSIPLVCVFFIMNVLCACIVARTAFRTAVDVDVDWLSSSAALPLFAWVLLASYAGAALFTLRAFFQAINNFDLSPLSFIGATVNILLGLASGLLFVFGVLRITETAHLWEISNPGFFPIILITAFAAGYFPDLAVRNITRLSKLRAYKTEDPKIYDSFKAIPIEIIDGIDLEIRSRLADYHIISVQNLAAANPLMLFVETPYGVYQIMDWVAQAQLCCSVGPTALLDLWRIGIRTIFDLERVALDPACTAPELIEEIGRIIRQKQRLDANGNVVYPSMAAIEADIRFRLESPHVHRLRQIFNQVGESLGTEARRLPPVLDCVPGANRNCPFVRPAAPQVHAKRPFRRSWRFVLHRV